jgi:hypothetical protein
MAEPLRGQNLDGFVRKGLGYEGRGFGGRVWRIWREHGGFRFQLEPLTPECQADFVAMGDDDLLSAFKPLVDEFSPTLSNAVAVARIWDEQLNRG